MDILASHYGHTRPAAIAARLASLRTIAPVLIIAPQVEDDRILTDADAPEELELSPEAGEPAPLELIEAAAKEFAAAHRRTQLRHWIAEWQVERSELRAFRTHLRTSRQTPEVSAEIERLSARLRDLDDFLIMEDSAEEVEPSADYDEFDADLPDELDGSFSEAAHPFRLGFDDLPEAYFTTQEAAQCSA